MGINDEKYVKLAAEVGEYLDSEVVEKHTKWALDGQADEAELREVYREFGRRGWLLPWADEKYGGSNADFLTSYVICNEIAKRALSGITCWLHGDVAAPYLGYYANEEQKDRYLPALVSGEKIVAVAMTEPNCGSDLASMRMTAVKDGDDYVINGQKCFITGGAVADLFVLALKTDPDAPGTKGISIVLVDADTPGLTRRRMEKVGNMVLDNAELFFENVRVPQKNLLGQEGKGFRMLMSKLQQERLMASVEYIGVAERAIKLAAEYAKQRIVFGTPLCNMQNTEFVLSDLYSKALAGRALVESLAVQMNTAENRAALMIPSSAAKLYTSEIAQECVRKSLQIHGGFGILKEYEIGRLFTGSPALSLAAGTSEIMKFIIGKDIFPPEKKH